MVRGEGPASHLVCGYTGFPALFAVKTIHSTVSSLGTHVGSHWPSVRGFVSGPSVLSRWYVPLSSCQGHAVLTAVGLQSIVNQEV